MVDRLLLIQITIVPNTLRMIRFFFRLTFVLLLIPGSILGQNGGDDQYGSVSGNIELYGQYYLEDSIINAAVPEQDLGLNSSTYIVYKYREFSAGLRYETYLNALEGYPQAYDGSGIGYKFFKWKANDFELTVGNFYEQFGSGMILRSYEERSLGLDNALDGVRARYTSEHGVSLTGLVSRQRKAFDSNLINGEGLLRGFDVEVDFMRLIGRADSSDLSLTIGGSFVSKYNTQNLIDTLILPKNVGAAAFRIESNYKNWRGFVEYMKKANDPYPSGTEEFNYLYKDGEGLFLNLGYSQKGFAVDFSAKHTDNIVWRSTNIQTSPTELLIGYVPTLNKQHTYNLASTLYPYNTNLFGEISYAGTVLYKVKKGTKLGGKYGMDVGVNLVRNYAPERKFISGDDKGRDGYSTSLFSTADSLFSQDFNIEIKKKFSKKVKASFMYINFIFDDRVVLVADKHELIYADIAVADVTWKIRPKKSVRIEVQHLWTEQDQGNWAFAQIEYSVSPHWSFTALNQFNYGNPEEDRQIQYALGNVAYVHKTNRVSLQYGKQRAGFFCVGGICRAVPASNSILLSLTSSF